MRKIARGVTLDEKDNHLMELVLNDPIWNNNASHVLRTAFRDWAQRQGYFLPGESNQLDKISNQLESIN